MKKVILIACLIYCQLSTFAQLTTTKESGGTVITKLGMGVKVNDGSTLTRDFYSINAIDCPLQLANAGIKTSYSTRYSFSAIGKVTPSEPITAYEVHHVLYNIFGEHIKTLSNKVVIDLKLPTEFNQYASWYASENNVSEYLICVSYVANVRTQTGTIWRYNFKAIQSELDKIKLKYDEGFAPPQKNPKDE
jgi:hypothetical protein